MTTDGTPPPPPTTTTTEAPPPPSPVPPGNEPPPEHETELPGEGGGDDGDDLSGREAKARREARNLRAQLKAEREGRDEAIAEATSRTTAELNDRISDLETQVAERDAMISAVGKFRDPRDVARYIDVTSVPAGKLDDEIAKVLAERPYLAAVNGSKALPQGQQSEPATANGADDWLRKTITGRR